MIIEDSVIEGFERNLSYEMDCRDVYEGRAEGKVPDWVRGIPPKPKLTEEEIRERENQISREYNRKFVEDMNAGRLLSLGAGNDLEAFRRKVREAKNG